jgi:hypothetical protein
MNRTKFKTLLKKGGKKKMGKKKKGKKKGY